ncbi:LAMI_0F01618g1_1 [Lachancea mirantina]|uniref:LAMI_0F01618g1_1 n=1 Tax=Lachancea mirantina TaxID=1230905 RepID=A0A1G4JW02_9SACH|nr:LAMI_0F01618g1_1 [Lachancea mirantina]
MVLPTNIRQLLRTCRDFENALPIVGYYIKLFAVEEILSSPSRNDEMTESATLLLDEIENFKNSPQDEATRQLLEDQTKAKTYVMNFTLSLYNEQLAKIQAEKFDNDLRRALRCCIDLLGTILGLWKDSQLSEGEPDQCYKKIKICKFYLSKLAKGELTSKSPSADVAETSDEDIDDLLAKLKQRDEVEPDTEVQKAAAQGKQEEAREEKEEHLTRSLDHFQALANSFKDIPTGDSDIENEKQEDEEAEALLQQLRKMEASDNTAEQNESEIAKTEAHMPVFLDDDESSLEAATAPIVEEKDARFNASAMTEHPAPIAKPKYTKEDLDGMLQREQDVSQIQKMARYAISALNYEDFKTAKKQLQDALEVLENINY